MNNASLSPAIGVEAHAVALAGIGAIPGPDFVVGRDRLVDQIGIKLAVWAGESKTHVRVFAVFSLNSLDPLKTFPELTESLVSASRRMKFEPMTQLSHWRVDGALVVWGHHGNSRITGRRAGPRPKS